MPDLQPTLYRPKLRFDFNHLNHEGSLEFTRILAETFTKLLEAAPRDGEPGKPGDGGQ